MLLTATSCVISVPVATQEPYTDEARPVFTQGKGTRNPIIQSFTATPTNVTQGQAITFQVAAHDPDRQPLQLNWSATDGTLSTNAGHVVSWIPPATPGTYTVMVTVSNGRGGFATGAHNLIVQADGSAKIGVTPMASAAPTVQINPSASPVAIPSGLLSPGASPLTGPSPSASSTPGPSAATPSPSASSTAAPVQRVLVPLPFTSQEAFERVPLHPVTNITQTRKFRVVSASGRQYATSCQSVGYEERPGSRGGTSVSFGEGKVHVVNRVVLLQFTPQDAFLLPDVTRVDVLLKDGVEGFYLLPNHAVKFPESNWSFGADVSDELKHLEGTCYVFKFDESDTSPLTFHLP